MIITWGLLYPTGYIAAWIRNNNYNYNKIFKIIMLFYVFILAIFTILAYLSITNALGGVLNTINNS